MSTTQTELKKPTHPTLLEGLAMFEALRRFGFSPDDIYFHAGPETASVALKVGEVIVGVIVGNCDIPAEKVYAQWREAALWWNSCSNEDALDVWEGSVVRNHLTDLALHIMSKGLPLPKLLN